MSGPPEITGLVGFGFTVTTTGSETDLQVPEYAVSVMVDPMDTVMLAVVSPVLHLWLPVAEVVNTTVPP